MTEPTLPPEPAKDATADELEADIAATRHQLGETIDALEDKLDVSAQAKRKVDQTKAELANKVNTAKSQLTSKVTAVRTQVTDKVSQTKTQVTDKVAHTQAKVTGKKGGPTTEPVRDPGYVADTVYPAEGGVGDSSLGSSQVTSTGQASRTQAVTDQVKNISTRLANKVAEVRTRTSVTGPGDDARRAELVDGIDPAPGAASNDTGSTKAQSASTRTAVAGKVGQTKTKLASQASQFRDRVRQNPRTALYAAVSLLASVSAVWLAWRAAKTPDPVLKRG